MKRFPRDALNIEETSTIHDSFADVHNMTLSGFDSCNTDLSGRATLSDDDGDSTQWPTATRQEASQDYSVEQDFATGLQICAPWDIIQPTDTPLWSRLMSNYCK